MINRDDFYKITCFNKSNTPITNKKLQFHDTISRARQSFKRNDSDGAADS